jgi:hypothetical protein
MYKNKLQQSRHLDNYGSNEFEPDIRYGIETYKKLLESLGNRAAPTDQNRLVFLCVGTLSLAGRPWGGAAAVAWTSRPLT